MEALANFTFQATDKDELGFCKGQIVKILEFDGDEHWYTAELDGNEGMVPKNYLTCTMDAWFVGRMQSQEVASRLLLRPTGHFMIRHSQSVAGDFALSVRENPTGVVHYKIRNDRGQYGVWDVMFNSLNELVAYYKCNSISRATLCMLRDLDDSLSEYLVQALFAFTPTEAGDLPLRAGDLVRVTAKDDSGWWEGIANGRKGLFPCTYVVPFRSGQLTRSTTPPCSNSPRDTHFTSRSHHSSSSSSSSPRPFSGGRH